MATTRPTKKQSDAEVLAATIDEKLNKPSNINEKSRWAAIPIGGIVGHGQVLRTPKRDKTMISYGLKGGKFLTVYGIDVDELRRNAVAEGAYASARGYDKSAMYWDATAKALDAEPTKSKLDLVSAALKTMPSVASTSRGDSI